MSGHSKWHNIQKTKGAQDAKRAAAFTKISKEMIVAVKEGGGVADPAYNSRLATVITKAKAANMPNDNIKRVLEKAASAGQGYSYEAITYEGHGPSGIAVIVETMTDNRKRTAGNIRHHFDKYGGSLENRLRFAREIVEEIKRRCGQDFPVMLRYSPKSFIKALREGALPGEEFEEKGRDLPEGVEAAKLLVSYGYDALDVDVGSYDAWWWSHPPMYQKKGLYMPYAKLVKENVNVPVLCAGRMDDPDMAEGAVMDGVCDIISLGRPLLADPDYVNKLRRGERKCIRPCISCLNCMKTMACGEMHCAVNAQGAFECTRSTLRQDGDGRPVAVIGGGPAGMEAARVLALRGFQVTLWEQNDRLGGALLQAAKPPHKEKILAFVRYLTHQLDKLGVTVRLGQAAAPEAVAELHPYAVLVAAGASPLIPSRIPGIHGSQVYTASDLLTDKVTLEGQTVVVIGAGMTGLETAEYLKSKGNRVSVYDLLPEVAHGEHFQNIIDIEHRLGDVPQYTSHKLVEIAPDSCIFETEDGTRETAPCDAVILAMGMRPNQDVAQQFAAFPNCHTIGTCVQYGNIAYAVESGFLAASQL